MSDNLEPPLSLIKCPRCRKEIRIEPQQVVASNVLDYLNEGLPQLLGRHQRGLDAILAHEQQQLAEIVSIEQLRAQLEDSNKQRVEIERQRDEFRLQAQQLADRLAVQFSESTAARTDVGRTIHTSHRQLADQVAALLGRINAVARKRVAADGMVGPEGRLRSEAAALIFRLLFTPEDVPREEHERWAAFTRDEPQAGSLTRDCSDLARVIRETAGYQKWIWDFAPKGTQFDPGLHEAWQNCDPGGEVQFVVIPAYLVDFAVIAKPRVFTNWADH